MALTNKTAARRALRAAGLTAEQFALPNVFPLIAQALEKFAKRVAAGDDWRNLQKSFPLTVTNGVVDLDAAGANTMIFNPARAVVIFNPAVTEIVNSAAGLSLVSASDGAINSAIQVGMTMHVVGAGAGGGLFSAVITNVIQPAVYFGVAASTTAVNTPAAVVGAYTGAESPATYLDDYHTLHYHDGLAVDSVYYAQRGNQLVFRDPVMGGNVFGQATIYCNFIPTLAQLPLEYESAFVATLAEEILTSLDPQKATQDALELTSVGRK